MYHIVYTSKHLLLIFLTYTVQMSYGYNYNQLKVDAVLPKAKGM
jgi:hypothetical protein